MSILNNLSVNKRLGHCIIEGNWKHRGFLNKSRKSHSCFSYFLTCQEWQLCSMGAVENTYWRNEQIIMYMYFVPTMYMHLMCHLILRGWGLWVWGSFELPHVWRVFVCDGCQLRRTGHPVLSARPGDPPLANTPPMRDLSDHPDHSCLLTDSWYIV